jgi:predicted DNA-binding transcriptional regulator AlpA
MAASLESLAHLPDWPAMLSAEQAAAYVGLSRETFLKAVEAEDYPKPVRSHGKRVLWWRPGLDRAAAVLAGERIAANDRPGPIDQAEFDEWRP